MLRKCPHHGIGKGQQIQYFYAGLLPSFKKIHIRRPVAYKEKVPSTDEEHVEQTEQAVDIEESSVIPQVKAAAPIKPYEPPIPYPQRLNPKKKKQDQQCVEFLDHLRKLYINIPFVEALTQMPNYAKRLGIGEAKPAKFNLQLADRSVKKQFGLVEDVVMRVGKLLLPIDFVVFDMPDDAETPIILGRPFLATSDALIDVSRGVLTLRVQHE
ncbi:Aspartic peptidase domain superfamily [Abeliophyllum distichum]|uniref:Aspartic peptidase domain superfamily n=1 Tax=Abeliophyllum distichum TaxID=126358 RepID=A0ABD1VR81_9LAMI